MSAREAAPDDARDAASARGDATDAADAVAGTGGRPPETAAETDGELTRAEALIAQLWDDLASLRSLHTREVAQLRKESENRIRELRRELSDARGGDADAPVDAPAVGELRAHLEEVEEELQDVYDSETWLVGRAFVYLPRQAKLALQEWWQERRAGRR